MSLPASEQNTGARRQAGGNSTEIDPEAPVVGVDVGATLAKLCVRDAAGALSFGFLPSSTPEAVARRVAALAPRAVGLTGCGASDMAGRLSVPIERHVEFDAWGAGASALLEQDDLHPMDEPYALVSVGTGSSVLRVHRREVSRLGGSALGGGTVVGLGTALTGCESFEELAGLAESGSRSRIDLLVRDIYAPGEIAIPGEACASAFGKLARWLGNPNEPRSDEGEMDRGDLAAAVMGLVGENVALIVCGLAAAHDLETVVYAGSTLRSNPSLAAITLGVTAALGRRPLLLPEGGHAGAVGALLLTEDKWGAVRSTG